MATSQEDQATASLLASDALTSSLNLSPEERIPKIRIFFAGMALAVAMGVGAAYPEQVRGAGATVVDGVEEVGGAVGRTMEWIGDKVGDGWDAIKRKLKEVEERNKRDRWFTGGE